MSSPGGCGHEPRVRAGRARTPGLLVIVSWRVWRALRAKQQPFPHDYQILVRRLTGQPSAFYTLGEALRPPRLLRRGVRLTSMAIALILGILSPLIVIIALIAFAISFLIAPVLIPTFVTLFCAELAASLLGTAARVRDGALIGSTPPGRSGLLWLCATNAFARRTLLFDLIFIYVSFVAVAMVMGILRVPPLGGLATSPPILAGLIVGAAVALFLACDVIQTSVLSILLSWTLIWEHEENASQARLISSGIILIIQIGLYAASVLMFALLGASLQAGAALLIANVLARELLVIAFARGLLRQGMELDAIIGLRLSLLG